MDSDSHRYGFNVNLNSTKGERIELNVRGVVINFIVDSGSDCNLIYRKLWEKSRQHIISCSSRRQIKPYIHMRRRTVLSVVRMFDVIAEREGAGGGVESEFVVVDHTAEPLLGREPAKALGILGIELQVNNCVNNDYSN